MIFRTVDTIEASKTRPNRFRVLLQVIFRHQTGIQANEIRREQLFNL